MTTVILALIAGSVVGVALGGLGGGGSMLAIPALIYLLRFSPSQATTASLLIVAATSLTGLIAHARAGRVRWRTGTLFATAGLPAAAVAGAVSAKLPGALLTVAFALLAGLAAGRMLIPGAGTVPSAAAGLGKATAAGAGLGAITGLLGVGGGFLAVPALVSVLAFPMGEAIGTSLLVISANALAALLPRLGGTGAVGWAIVGPFTGTAVLGAWGGERWAKRFSGRTLQKVFGITLLAIAALMLIDALL
ncbi:sulfite exporter TauE/SafE family protein [Actinoallomurus sp. NBC_01490]|uniref:sulfite exporter TauE/SafE family protein n=1 Tax=Actinoallomurus sp. NBC_01490 TaxID=2903557 RepID=UPI002E2F7209|nr:sulfite exporter TauE/SafE family protein [Actinoallomurus sp. NBC_01490]